MLVSYKRIEYCLVMVLSEPRFQLVLFVNNKCIVKINRMFVRPSMVSDIRTFGMFLMVT